MIRTVLLALVAFSAHANTLTGHVVGITDGDTITVIDLANQQHKIRLAGIDAPEKAQPFGQRSKQNLSDLVFNRTVTVEYDKQDRYGRTLGRVMASGKDANLEQDPCGHGLVVREIPQRAVAGRSAPVCRGRAAGEGDTCRAVERSGTSGAVGLAKGWAALMCTRYISPEQAEIEAMWHIGRHNSNKWIRDVFPRSLGPFLRLGQSTGLDLVVGTWGLIPSWSKTPRLTYSTCNCRSEEASAKPTFRNAWRTGQRCIIPAMSFDEPCWETGKNVWWRFRRLDGLPWGLAGLWNTWVDHATGEVVESYTMLTVNADKHPIMARMHKPDTKLPANQQDKRSVVAIEQGNIEQWLRGSVSEALELVDPPALELIDAGPAQGVN